MGANVKIRQRRKSGAASAPVGEKYLSCEKGGLKGEGLAKVQFTRDGLFQFLDSSKSNRDFCVNERIDDQHGMLGGFCEGTFRPKAP